MSFLELALLGILVVYPAWRVFERAGFSPYFSLLTFVPGVGWLIVLAILAFSPWPALSQTPQPPQGVR
jgi:hypothetical protein